MKTVDHVDLKRYMGDWYVIAHMPNWLEKNKVGTLDAYYARPDGKIDNIYKFRRKSLDAPLEEWKALAWVKDTQTNAEWRVQFVWPLRTPYLIVGLDDDYQWSVVGHPSRKLGWILSRRPTMEPATYERLVHLMKTCGYDVDKLQKVPQK